MLDASLRARDVLGQGGALARVLPGFEHRDEQIRMAELVEVALAHEGAAIVEAGTGTGKTLAYLVPAVLSDARRVVVSTGTKTLQDQIVESDVPLLERALGVKLRVAALKGLSSYLCLRRWDELKHAAESLERPEIGRLLPVIDDFRWRTRTGDRAELGTVAEDSPIWAAVSSSSETRIGPRCTFHDDCFVTKARRRAEQARIVVVNHHLFFADLALRRANGAGVIPDYDAVIFDEAHQLEDIATQFRGNSLSTSRVEALVRDVERTVGQARMSGEDWARLTRSVLVRAADLFDAVRSTQRASEPPARGPAQDGPRLPLARDVLEGALRHPLFDLEAALDALARHAEGTVEAGEPLMAIARRCDRMRSDIAELVDAGAGSVAWSQQRGRVTWIGASPVDVSASFRDEVLHRAKSVVLTSATLSTSGTFDFLKRRLGFDHEVDEAILSSPFHYPTQAALYLPPELPEPREAGYTERAIDEIVRLVALVGGGAFVLCTSIRAMQDLSRACRGRLFAGELLVQGEAPKTVVLERFRRDGNAVLFATQSFWEGVDVPGDALRLVVIDKLPFDVPSDPLVKARCERIEAEGGTPFVDYLVPSAAITLKQGFGRLVRTRRDRGIVALLDSRVTKRGYGKLFLRSLPDATRCTSFDEVTRFWRA